MDSQTIHAYEKHGSAFAERYRTGQRIPTERFREAFGERSKILEIGAGSGVDMARLLEAGYDVTGMEPSATLRCEAIKHFPELSSRLREAALPLPEALVQQWAASFGGIHCSAVLMHLSDSVHHQAIYGMSQILEDDGRLLLTISATRDGLDDERRDEFGRYYAELTHEYIDRLCLDNGMRIIQTWNDADQWHRRGLLWSTYLAEKPHRNDPMS